MSGWNIFGKRTRDAQAPAPIAALDPANPEHVGVIEALTAAARGSRDPSMTTPELEASDRSVAYLRYNGILAAYAPWLERRLGRRPGLVLEFGCGSGASTAAFAHVCERIVGYDIDPVAVETARLRFRLLGLSNASADLIGRGPAHEAFGGHLGVDGVILYAVLEHMEATERRALLAAAWAALQPGGFVLIGETPNGLGANGAAGHEELSATIGEDYARHIVSDPSDPEIAGVFGDDAEAASAIQAAARGAGQTLHPSMLSPRLSLLLVKPGAEPAWIPEPEPAAASEDPTFEALRAFALDDRNWDAFAGLIGEVLPRHVYLSWEKDAPYKRHFKAWQKAGVTILPNHYYSPIPDFSTLAPEALTARTPMHGVTIDLAEHRALLASFKPYQAEYQAFRQRNAPTQDGKWFSGGAFGLLDAQTAYAMVRSQRPRRVIEIGTGFSTLAMAEACARNAAEGAPVEFTTIDPYPSFAVDLKPEGLSANLTQPVEQLPLGFFEALEPGDFLFIDSTHVIRPGGDVEYEYFHLIPRLRPGVWVHVHDIFMPLPYPPEWARDRHIFWNEQQLLNAFLAYNHSFRARMALSALCDADIGAIKDAFPGTGDRPGPGSFWMQRVA